jgi:enterochelin esterase-like enzyme
MHEALVLFLAFDTGTLTRLPDRKKLFSVRGEIDHILLPQREIRVWLPPGYESSGDARYPVLYCHDGQHMMKEDEDVFPPPRSWRLGETLSSMLACDGVYKTPSIQAPIVVLIPNCHQNGTNLLGDIDFAGQPLFRRRWLEYGDTPLGRRYIDWVCDVLKPGIDAEYRTRPEPRHTHAMGSSMGGLCAFNSVWQRPDVFSNAACLSPAFNPPLLAEVATGDGDATRQRFRRLYIDNGGDTAETKVSPMPESISDFVEPGWFWLDTNLQPGVDAMCAALRWHHVEHAFHRAPGGRHNEAAWAARVERPLRHLLGR